MAAIAVFLAMMDEKKNGTGHGQKQGTPQCGVGLPHLAAIMKTRPSVNVEHTAHCMELFVGFERQMFGYPP